MVSIRQARTLHPIRSPSSISGFSRRRLLAKSALRLLSPVRRTASRGATAAASEPALNHGFWLPLIGHLFLVAVALNPAWSLPPWPLFGALAVVTLAMSVAALASQQVLFHALATVATAVVLSA